MNHLKQIAARLPEYGLDAMLLNSEPGEYYAVGFHGEGNVVVTAQGCFYFTDSRYIEAANHLITGAEIAMTGRSRNYRAMVQEVVDRCRIRKLGFEEGYLSVADYNLWKEGLTAELVPAQKLVDALRAAKDDGEIAQRPEDLVGPYDLHDFYLYHAVRWGASPDKVRRLALHAFRGEFDAATVDKWLKIFYRRFFAQQFKRSCLPDGRRSDRSAFPRAETGACPRTRRAGNG